eukprot:gene2153-biopygen8625
MTGILKTKYRFGYTTITDLSRAFDEPAGARLRRGGELLEPRLGGEAVAVARVEQPRDEVGEGGGVAERRHLRVDRPLEAGAGPSPRWGRVEAGDPP